MKLNKIKLLFLMGLSAAFISCQETEDTDQHYDNKLFISASNLTEEILFRKGDPDPIGNLKVAIAKPVENKITVTVKPAPELLATYKKVYYDETAVILPKENYSMTQTTTTINPGTTDSPSLPIEFINVGDLDLKTVYVLPVTITSVEGIGLLQSAKNYYYIFKGASLVNVVCNISTTRAYPNWKNGSIFNNLAQNTMEILVKGTSFPNQLHSLMGIEGHYLLRVGDANMPSNQVQLASSPNLTNSDLTLDPGKWYHIAVTFDAGNVKIYLNGAEKLSGKVDISKVNFGAAHTNEDDGSRCFWVGYSYKSDRNFNGCIAETRIWNRVLSAEEIQSLNHFYWVDPASEGLIAYWKFSEGTGTVAKDYSVNGNDLTIEKEPKWETVALP